MLRTVPYAISTLVPRLADRAVLSCSSVGDSWERPGLALMERVCQIAAANKAAADFVPESALAPSAVQPQLG